MILGLPLLALGVAILFLTFMFSATDGHFVPQVVDLYLVCQYARSFAEGHPFQYNIGDPPSTGSTSLLYTVYLGLAHASGFRGEGLVAFAIVSGIACFVASVLIARRLGTLLGGSRAGLLAGTLVVLSGPVAWGFLYGSDIAPFMLLALWLLERFVAGWPTGSLGHVVPGVLLALTRPEGLPLGIATALGWNLGPGRGQNLWRRAVALGPLAASGAVLLLYRLMTGSALGSSVADKSLFANYGVSETFAIVTEYGVDVIRGLLLGFYPSQTPVGFGRGWAPFYFPPLGLALLLLAVARVEDSRRTPLVVWLSSVALVFALLSPNMFLGFHFNRYILWAIPGLLVLVAVGVHDAARLLARGDTGLERRLFASAALVVLGTGALSTGRFAVLYGDLAGDVYRRDVAVAQWISKNLPAGVAMANVATSVEYLTGHRNLNLHGVTSPAFFGNRPAERDANVVESLERIAAAERPPYLIATASALDATPALREIAATPPLFSTTGFGDEILILKTHYELLGRGAEPRLPETLQTTAALTEVDRLNVCDTRDEARHDYTYRSRMGNLSLHGTARIGQYPGSEDAVVDGGRAILEVESFKVRTIPGRDLIVVMRTAPNVSANVLRASGGGALGIELPEAGVILKVDGQTSGRLTFKPRAGWDELILRITRNFITRERTQLEIRGRYASFRYWFYQ